MIDIARRRGMEIDLDKLSAELGVPVITAAAVRRGGTDDLMRRLDELAAATPTHSGAHGWQAPTASDLRAAQREADRLIKAAVRMPDKPDTLTTRLDALLLHPVIGLVILLAILFVMFQAVFTWAQPLMESDFLRLRRARHRWCTTRCPPACCRASCRTASSTASAA